MIRRLAAGLFEALTFLTQRLSARARAPVFTLDVVAGVAVGVVVMDIRLR